MEVRVAIDPDAGRVVARVLGEASLGNAHELRAHLMPLLTVGARTVVVDVSRTVFTDAAGPAVLVAMVHEAARLGVDLVVERPGRRNRVLLHQTGLDRSLHLRNGGDQAERVPALD